jgi:hypothetical protein
MRWSKMQATTLGKSLAMKKRIDLKIHPLAAIPGSMTREMRGKRSSPADRLADHSA